MLTMTKTRPIAFHGTKKSPLSMMSFFKNIPSDAFWEIEHNMVEKKYAKRESIFLENDLAESIWFVKEGHVKEIHHSPEGQSNTICMVGANGMFGVSAFSGGEYGFHCLAETDATVISFPIQFFQTLIGKYPQMARDILSKISKLLRWSKDMQTFSQESAEKRILHVLVEMVREFGNVIPLTRKEIAEMAGTAVETCIRACIRLEDVGLIRSVHGQITVKNVNDLVDRIDEV
jgi:CRP/FNR family transcriptional regulator